MFRVLRLTYLMPLEEITEEGEERRSYCPRYQPIPYRSRKLVIIVSEFA